MRPPVPPRGSTPGYRSVAYLGLFVLVCTGYVACGGEDRHFGSDHGSGGETADVGAAGDQTSGGNGDNSGGNTGSSSGGKDASGGNANAGRGGTTGTGGGKASGGRTGTGATGTGATRDASDDGPTSNAN
jgi:hypothetical protein